MSPTSDPSSLPDEFVPSPCIGICTMEGDYCAGCYRTLDEIAFWATWSSTRRREVLLTLEERRDLDRAGHLGTSEEPSEE